MKLQLAPLGFFLFIALIGFQSVSSASIPVGSKMTYRIFSSSGTPENCNYRAQIVHKEILSFDSAANTYQVHIRYINEADGKVVIDTKPTLDDTTRKMWGIYSTEEIQYMSDHCEE